MQYSVDLLYGKSSVTTTLPQGVRPLVIVPNEQKALDQPLAAVRQALNKPTGTAPLREMLLKAKPQTVVVVVNDETRPTPYDILFPPLLEAFAEAGIKDEQISFIIATGIHEPHSDALNEKTYGAAMTQRFRFISHVATDASSLVHMGRFASGYDFYVNKLAVEADFLITLGVVMPHYFAGFSGGRKSILPGLAGHTTVELNHARMVELMDALPPIRQNPVSLEMIEAARQVGVDFILNVVTNDNKQLIRVVAGDVEQAWYEAVAVSSSMYEIPFARQVDICIASASGYPRDVNVYQAQKALDHADRITRDGGTIILAAECPSGYGEEVFEAWMRERMSPQEIMQRIKSRFVMGGHKAYGFAKVAAHKEFMLYSALDTKHTEMLFAKKIDSIDTAVKQAFLKYGPNATVAVLPQGSLTLPVPA